jgi:hypothetical protein
MARSHDENDPFNERFSQLLDAALSNPPEETTTREQLATSRDKIVRCLRAGISRRFLHTQFVVAGGVVSYQRFCVLLNELLHDEEVVNGIKGRGVAAKGRVADRDRERGNGSKLIAARRSDGGIGKTLGQIQSETTQALVRVAGFEEAVK